MGKTIYFTDKQLEYLIIATDPHNSQDDEEKDKVRAQIHDKVTK